MYTIKRSEFDGQWKVINTMDGTAQSSWNDKITAHNVMQDLNRAFKIQAHKAEYQRG